MTLTEKASEIINSPAQTPDDIKELSRIAFNMSKLYREQRRLCGIKEHSYNKHRSEKSIEARGREGITATEAETIGKYEAEKEFGDYRQDYEDMVGMREVLRQIDAFRISRYTVEKGIENAIVDGVN